MRNYAKIFFITRKSCRYFLSGVVLDKFFAFNAFEKTNLVTDFKIGDIPKKIEKWKSDRCESFYRCKRSRSLALSR